MTFPARGGLSRAAFCAAILAGTLSLAAGAHAQQAAQAPQAPRVKLSTNLGDIVVEVYPDKAPKTAENFLQYVREKHYDGTIFHRVISNFMIQGGGFDASYVQRKTRAPIAHEGRDAMKAGLRNVTGTLAMARTGDPNSASDQFFINVQDNGFLDPTPIPPGDPVPRFEYQGRVYENIPRAQLLNAPPLFGYTVFGKVVSGMDVVEKIRHTPTGPGGPFPTDAPKTMVVIQRATIEK